ncbi:MAG: hypothetical protein KDI45_06320 [Candidatus Accumulibacter sp.]|nr:hypothetical protein [Accumulibacter sp.]
MDPWGFGLVAAFRGQRASPSGGKDFSALGGGARGAPEGLGKGIGLTGGGSAQNDRNPNFMAMAYLIAGKLTHLRASPFTRLLLISHETT